MLNLSELLIDPDFAQPFTIQRSSGSFQLGGFQSTVTMIGAVGAITVASEQDLDQVPEGDRVTGAMTFYTATPLFRTHADGGAPGLSDVLLWRGDAYRIQKIWPYADYGYYKAVAVRTSGA